MSKSKRGDNLRYSQPGPADYDIKFIYKHAPKVKFGTSGKNQKRENSPGPADYKIPCSIRDVPNFVRKNGAFDEHYTFV